MELYLSILTYVLLGIGVWTAVVAFYLGRTLFYTRKHRGTNRKADIWTFTSLITALLVILFVVLIYPGLLHMIPSTTATLEVGSIPILWFLTEKYLRNWNKCKSKRTC